MTLFAGMQIFQWEPPGYQPLVFSAGWQVAILNAEPGFQLENLGEIERHNQTDEVFVLLKGKAVLFCIPIDGDLQIQEMLPNTIYNITRGSWHNLVSSADASWLIVENRDTHLGDTEFRQLSDTELKKIRMALGSWED
jgi:ureidoglycolate hydrolase